MLNAHWHDIRKKSNSFFFNRQYACNDMNVIRLQQLDFSRFYKKKTKFPKLSRDAKATLPSIR